MDFDFTESMRLIRINESLIKAVENTDLRCVKIALDSGADINVKLEYDLEKTLLHLAINNRQSDSKKLELIELLLDRGINIDAKNKSGNTALHLASKSCNHELVMLLTKYGADVNCRNNLLSSSLHLVASQGYTETLIFLIESGANINYKDHMGRSPLDWAIKKKQTAKVEFLNNYLDKLKLDETIHDSHGQSSFELAF